MGEVGAWRGKWNYDITGATPNSDNKSNNMRRIYLKKKNLRNLHDLWIFY